MDKNLKKNKAIRKIVGNMNHDISTPLATIKLAGLRIKRQMPALLKLYDDAIKRGEEVHAFDPKICHLMSKLGEIIMNKGTCISTLLEQYSEQIKTIITSEKKLNETHYNIAENTENEDCSSIEEENKIKVLLVDDEVFNLEIEREVLTSMGCAVEIAMSGSHAIELIKDKDYDLVFMDCYMPAPDGFETTKQIRSKEEANSRRTTIIGVTASLLDEDRLQAIKAGMDDFITRPVSMDIFNSFLRLQNDN